MNNSEVKSPLETFFANGLAAQRAVDTAVAEQARRANADYSHERAARPRVLNETVFINRAAVRDFLLEHAAGTRAHRFERVSKETLVRVNECARQCMISIVRALPSKGKTI